MKGKFLIAFVCMVLMASFPLVDALSLSNLRTTDISNTHAVVRFETDEGSSSEVKYGLDPANLNESVINNNFRTNHSFGLATLLPNTNYFYEVVLRAGAQKVVDDNNGNKHTFSTPATDTIPPRIDVNIPKEHNQIKIDIQGETEAGTSLTLAVNGKNVDADVATHGVFSFVGVVLEPGKTNALSISAQDQAGLTNQKDFQIQVDVVGPEVKLAQVFPAVVSGDNVKVSGALTEAGNLKVVVNGNEQFEEDVQGNFSLTVDLEEGENEVVFLASDAAGNVERQVFKLEADSEPPEIEDVEPLGDNPFYYEGRAIDDVNGKTEPGARVFLYVVPVQFSPDTPNDLDVREIVNRSQHKTVADANGAFEFDDVNFQFPIPSDILEIAPREIAPLELQTGSGDIQSRPLKVFIAVVDKVGNTAKERFDLRIGSCFSGDFDFTVKHLPNQQFPSTLSPDRLDGGYEAISFVMGLEYRGSAEKNRLNISQNVSDISDNYYEVVDIQLEPACRRGEIRKTDDSYDVACSLLGKGRADVVQEVNAEKTNWYFKFDLGSSNEFTNRSPEFWQRFSNSEIKFPFKVNVLYSEKLPGDAEESKQQLVCRDVGYFVDVPIDPRDVLPDFLLEDSVELVNDTIAQIEMIEPLLDQAIKFTGVGCIGGFALRFVTQLYRRYIEKWELAQCKVLQKVNLKGGGEGESEGSESDSDKIICPGEGTFPDKKTPVPDLEHWWIADNLKGDPPGPKAGVYTKGGKFSTGYYDNLRLDTENMRVQFTGTIEAWSTEASVYKAYRFLCDRVFCHAAPAGWTQTKSLGEIKRKKFEERSCAAEDSGGARDLRKIDNCFDEFGPDGQKVLRVSSRSEILKNECFALGNAVYIVKTDPGDGKGNDKCPQATYLERIDNIQIQTVGGRPVQSNLCAVDRTGNGNYYTADTRKCEAICKGAGNDWKGQCMSNDDAKKEGFYPAGATSDCWYGNHEGVSDEDFDPQKYQCFCEKSLDKELDAEEARIKNKGARFAGCEEIDKDAPTKVVRFSSGSSTSTTPTTTTPPAGGTPGAAAATTQAGAGAPTRSNECAASADEWAWTYREQTLYREEGGGAGTYYPKERYYDDRDFSAAFGLDHLFDYLPGEKSITEVNPFTQHVGAVQSVCLTGIRSRLRIVKSILVGYNSCMTQIKLTGTADGGICKELFTQYICNLAYKVLSFAESGCVPNPFGPDLKWDNLDDENVRQGGSFDSLSNVAKFGSAALTETVDASVADIEAEYGNAKLDNFLQGGTDSLSKKVCLAAFGIDSGLDFNTFFDAAYSVPFKTSASVFSSEGAVGRREFLGFNPRTFDPRYEYRAAWAIFPGCPLESYDIDLVAVTEKERREFDNVDCDAVKNAEPQTNGCDNLRANKIQSRSLFNGDKVNQGQIIDENRALVVEDPYRYDHVRIRLHLDPGFKAEQCFPKENIQGDTGEFFFPIQDATARDILQCSVDASSAKFLCSSFDLQGIGQAWLEDVTCWDNGRSQYARCDQVVHTAAGSNVAVSGGDPVRVKAKVFTSGTKMCVGGQVATRNAGIYPKTSGGKDVKTYWPIIGLGQPQSVPLEMDIIPEITLDMLTGANNVNLDPRSAITHAIIKEPSTGLNPTRLFFASTDVARQGRSLGTIDPKTDYYAIGAADSWIPIDANRIISIGKGTGELQLRVDKVDLTLSKTKKKSKDKDGKPIDVYMTQDDLSGDKDPDKGIDFIRVSFVPKTGAGSVDQQWTVNVELFYPNDKQECTGRLVSVKVPTQVAFVPKKTIPISVRRERVLTENEATYQRAIDLYNRASRNSNKIQLREAANIMKNIRTKDSNEVHATYWYTIATLKYIEIAKPAESQRKELVTELHLRLDDFLRKYNAGEFVVEGKLVAVKDYPTDYKTIKEYLEVVRKAFK